MISFPHAKINLGLRVVEKRPDGYHNIETIFYPVSFCDVLEIVPLKEGKEDKFAFTGLELPGPPSDNLCVKAVDRFRKEFHFPAVSLHLHKIIPAGAGLGGGSSDAAFTIKMLNAIFKAGLPDEKMAAIAGELGSDCPFFIYNQPVYATGRGDRFQKAEPGLSAYYKVLVIPPVHVSTAEAYKRMRPSPSGVSLMETSKRPVKEWKGLMQNDFEEYAFTVHPEIAAIRDELYRAGALFALMSGSGSSVFGIFEKKTEVRLENTRIVELQN